MKKLLSVVTLLGYACTCLSAELPFYRETEHFKMFCMPGDQKVADLILTKDETDLKQLEIDFQHTLYGTSNGDKHITLKMYPSIEDFHTAIDKPQAPNWLILNMRPDQKLSQFVSPNNPGTFHTYNSLMQLAKVNLVQFILSDMFPSVKISQWLKRGITFYESNYGASSLHHLLQYQTQIPTLEQLESAGDDAEKFDALHGFDCAYWLAAFLFEKWGWNTIKALITDYKNFESILGMSKQEFMKQWVEFLIQKSK